MYKLLTNEWIIFSVLEIKNSHLYLQIADLLLFNDLQHWEHGKIFHQSILGEYRVMGTLWIKAKLFTLNSIP